MLRQLIIANNLLCAYTLAFVLTFPILLHYDFKLFTFMSTFWLSFDAAVCPFQRFVGHGSEWSVWTSFLIKLSCQCEFSIFDLYDLCDSV